MLKTFIGDFNVGHKLEIISLSSEHRNLTLNTKQGTDLGTLVVLFNANLWRNW